MPMLQANKVNLYYEIHGEGFPLVCIAGLSADHTSWTGLLDNLVNDFKVILFDNRGIGKSDVPKTPYSIEEMSEDVYALCNSLNIPEAFVMGSSMGGFITQQLMRKYPTFVKASVLINSTRKSTKTFNTFFEGMLELIEANAPIESRIKLILSQVYSSHFLGLPGKLEELIQLSINYPYQQTIQGAQNQFAALQTFDSTSWINEINIPSLVVCGEEDLVFPEIYVRGLAESLANGQYCLFPKTAHMPHHEYPKEFVEVLKSFLLPLK